MKKLWFVYIIQTEAGKLYTGITTDLERRFSEHQAKRSGAKYFNIAKPLKIVFKEACSDRSEASKKESCIKKMTRQEKLILISIHWKFF